MTASAASRAVRSAHADEVGAPAELLALPRAERLDRVGGHDQRDAVDEPGQEPAEGGVPRVGVDDVRVGRAGRRGSGRRGAPGRRARRE